MEKSVTSKKDMKTKSILRPKTSKGFNGLPVKKHLNIIDNKDNVIIKTEKKQKPENLLLSKFDFKNDYIKRERKAFSIKLKNLNKINLLENKIDNLYEWENLFNNFKPTHSYISLKKYINKKESSQGISENLKYDSPILLVDLPESQMNLFFNRNNNYQYNSLSEDKKNLNIRPVSIYSPREENSCFYYSNTFSDYYKEDFKTFCEKIPILKAKLRVRAGKLRQEVHKRNGKLIKKYKILEEKRKDKNIIFNKEHLIIAGKRKNPIPLIKNVILEKYKSQINYNENEGFIDDDNSKRKKILNFGIKSNDFGKNFGNRLLLSYYDVNDPSLALFNDKLIQENKTRNNKIFSKSYNDIDNNIKKYQEKQKSLKKDKEVQKCSNEEKPKKQNKTKKEIFKMKLGLYNIDNNSIKTNNLNQKSLNLTKNNKPLIKNNNINKEIRTPHSFPIKTSSDVGNISYKRIKKFIQDKQFINKFKFVYNSIPLTQPLMTIKTDTTSTDKSDLELIWDSKKIKPKKNFSLFESVYEKENEKQMHHHWDKNGNLINVKKNKEYNEIYFNKCIRTKFNKDLITLNFNQDNYCFYPINAFNKGKTDYYRMKNKKIFRNKKENNNHEDIKSINI